MPKTRLTFSDLPTNVVSPLTSGTYAYPASLTLDGSGRITQITTSTGQGIQSIQGTSGSIAVSTSTGSVVVSLSSVGLATTGTFTNIFSLAIDGFGRVTSATTTASVLFVGTATLPSSLTFDSYGRINNVSTSNTLGGTYNNSIISTSTFTSLTIVNQQYEVMSTSTQVATTSSPIIIDLNQGPSIVNGPAGLTGPWNLQFINAPLTTASSITTTVFVTNAFFYGLSIPGNIVSVNGAGSTVYWLSGTVPSTTPGRSISVYSFTFLYNGTTTTTYISSSLYSSPT